MMYEECVNDPAKIATVKKATDIFNQSNYTDRFRVLSKLCHPDLAPGLGESFFVLNSLYKDAQRMDSNNCWGYEGSIEVVGTHSPYHRKHTLDVGVAYVGDAHLVYEIDSKYTSLIKRVPLSFSFSSARMEEMAKSFLPQQVIHDNYLVVTKRDNQFLLRDLMEKPIDDKHIAWIISRLYNAICYFSYAGIVHAGLTADSLLVCPEDHTVTIAGGWLFSYKKDGKIDFLPRFVLDSVPKNVVYSKQATEQVMTSTVRAIGASLKPINPVLKDFFSEGGKSSAVAEYALWQEKILVSAFGERKFTKWNISKEDVY